MTLAEAKTLKAGESLSVSYKGIRPCTFKNLKGNCAFIEFDNGDGSGRRLHRVLATTLVKGKIAEKGKMAEPASKASPDPKDEAFEALRLLADKLGYELIAK